MKRTLLTLTLTLLLSSSVLASSSTPADETWAGANTARQFSQTAETTDPGDQSTPVNIFWSAVITLLF
jgi:hypothetical protein